MNVFTPNLDEASFYKIKNMLDSGIDPVMVPRFMAHQNGGAEGLYIFPLANDRTAYCVMKHGEEIDSGIEGSSELRSRYQPPTPH